MSDEFEGPIPEFGFPILFFHEDPDEKRQRIEGAQPPPESVLAPRLVGSAELEPDALEYRLLKFPWEPWSQGTETQSLARRYADWLKEIEAARLAEVRFLLEQAGAPIRRDQQEAADLAALGAWAQRWCAALAVPLVQQGFIDLDSIDRLGTAWVAPSPHHQGYSRSVDALVGSLAHDFAFIVVDSARQDRPDLAWQCAFDTDRRRFLITLGPDQQAFDLIEHLVEYVVQSAARPRGANGRELKHWYGLTLRRCRDRVVSGSPVPQAYEVFPDLRSQLSYPRRSVSRPKRNDPPAPTGLIEAAEKFQQAGWFESIRLGTADLARAAQAAWRRYEGEDITSDPAQTYLRMLLLDGGRTWSEDTEAGIQPGDGVYHAIAESLSHTGLKAIRGLDNTEEDWTSAPGDLRLILLAQRGKPQILIPSPAPYISAALFTGLNELLPDDGPKLWFFDHGPRLGIVTRATQSERDELESLTGIRLDRYPPAWWAALAPIPEYPAMARPDHSPAGPATAAKTRDSAMTRDSPRGAVSASRSVTAGGRRAKTAVQDPTAQQAFAHMMRDLIAPALRDIGFKGSATRGFFCSHGDYGGSFWTQKSRWSTKDKVEFWVHLSAAHEPTGSPYWNWQLHALIPGNDSFSHWTIRAGKAVEPVADHLLGVFRSYGWPAIQAALDSPGYPPDPDVTWARSFRAEPTPAAGGASGPNLGPLTWLVHRATHQDDDVFADLADPDDIVRTEAAVAIGLDGLRDARAVPALLNRLEFDPSASVRERAALALGRAADRPEVREAFLAAAAEDEDVQVRWAARYGLRIAANPASRESD